MNLKDVWNCYGELMTGKKQVPEATSKHINRMLWITLQETFGKKSIKTKRSSAPAHARKAVAKPIQQPKLRPEAKPITAAPRRKFSQVLADSDATAKASQK